MGRTWQIFAALLAGVFCGAGWTHLSGAAPSGALSLAGQVGGIWLDALRMTIVPLVVSLLVTGIARTAHSARGDRLALRSIFVFTLLLWTSTAIAALLIPFLLGAFPLDGEAARAMTAGLAVSERPIGAPAGIGEFLRSIVPTNPIAAAANDALLPLILFTSVFAIALSKLPEEQRLPMTCFFGAIGDAMLIVVDWILRIAPLGVFALAFALGVHAGASALGALAHYVLIVSCAGLAPWALAYPLAVFGGQTPLLRFVEATIPAQTVALSTQSSLAALPSMLTACDALGVSSAVSRVSLPLAVAIFRVTSPAMNLGVAIYVAHWLSVPLGPSAMAAGAAVAAITTMGSVSLPGQVSFLTSITPICVAMGVPIEPLVLLIAVEMIPDLVRTVGNVTMDVAATTVIARRTAAMESRGR